jgi:hypothetical protein
VSVDADTSVLPDFDLEAPERTASRLPTQQLARIATACIDELRERGRALAIEADRDVHATALRTIERLTTSADTVERLAQAQSANDSMGDRG